MVQLRAMQSRVARLHRRRESLVEKVCGSWEAFHDMMMGAVDKGEMAPEDAEDLYFAVRTWHEAPSMWPTQ